MALAAVHSNVMVLLLLFYTPPIFVVFLCFAIIVTRKRERERACYVALIVFLMFATVSFLRLFLAVQWVSLQCVIVVFHDHTHLLFIII